MFRLDKQTNNQNKLDQKHLDPKILTKTKKLNKK